MNTNLNTKNVSYFTPVERKRSPKCKKPTPKMNLLPYTIEEVGAFVADSDEKSPDSVSDESNGEPEQTTTESQPSEEKISEDKPSAVITSVNDFTSQEELLSIRKNCRRRCPTCERQVRLDMYVKHSMICRRNVVLCEYCSKRLQRTNLKKHLSICKGAPEGDSTYLISPLQKKRGRPRKIKAEDRASIEAANRKLQLECARTGRSPRWLVGVLLSDCEEPVSQSVTNIQESNIQIGDDSERVSKRKRIIPSRYLSDSSDDEWRRSSSFVKRKTEKRGRPRIHLDRTKIPSIDRKKGRSKINSSNTSGELKPSPTANVFDEFRCKRKRGRSSGSAMEMEGLDAEPESFDVGDITYDELKSLGDENCPDTNVLRPDGDTTGESQEKKRRIRLPSRFKNDYVVPRDSPKKESPLHRFIVDKIKQEPLSPNKSPNKEVKVHPRKKGKPTKSRINELKVKLVKIAKRGKSAVSSVVEVKKARKQEARVREIRKEEAKKQKAKTQAVSKPRKKETIKPRKEKAKKQKAKTQAVSEPRKKETITPRKEEPVILETRKEEAITVSSAGRRRGKPQRFQDYAMTSDWKSKTNDRTDKMARLKDLQERHDRRRGQKTPSPVKKQRNKLQMVKTLLEEPNNISIECPECFHCFTTGDSFKTHLIFFHYFKHVVHFQKHKDFHNWYLNKGFNRSLWRSDSTLCTGGVMCEYYLCLTSVSFTRVRCPMRMIVTFYPSRVTAVFVGQHEHPASMNSGPDDGLPSALLVMPPEDAPDDDSETCPLTLRKKVRGSSNVAVKENDIRCPESQPRSCGAQVNEAKDVDGEKEKETSKIDEAVNDDVEEKDEGENEVEDRISMDGKKSDDENEEEDFQESQSNGNVKEIYVDIEVDDVSNENVEFDDVSEDNEEMVRQEERKAVEEEGRDDEEIIEKRGENDDAIEEERKAIVNGGGQYEKISSDGEEEINDAMEEEDEEIIEKEGEEKSEEVLEEEGRNLGNGREDNEEIVEEEEEGGAEDYDEGNEVSLDEEVDNDAELEEIEDDEKAIENEEEENYNATDEEGKDEEISFGDEEKENQDTIREKRKVEEKEGGYEEISMDDDDEEETKVIEHNREENREIIEGEDNEDNEASLDEEGDHDAEMEETEDDEEAFENEEEENDGVIEEVNREDVEDTIDDEEEEEDIEEKEEADQEVKENEEFENNGHMEIEVVDRRSDLLN